ncbi:MAG: hypothetical protein EBZ49_10535, partial [Proteobacteria bacterium]|nr:hypothetical protein [Pseudomonadota bacterium]
MQTFYFEMTDTFGGELNYTWIKRFEISAKSLHGALIKLSRETGFKFRFNGANYKAQGAHVCAYELDADQVLHYSTPKCFKKL